MKSKSFIIIVFTLLFFSIAISQEIKTNCPQYFTHREIIDTKVKIVDIRIKDSGNYSESPKFILDIDSISNLMIYPKIAMRAKVEGQSVISLKIDTCGAVVSSILIKGCGAGIDEASLDVLKKQKFQPAMKENKVVSSEVVVYVNFELNVHIDKSDLLFDEIKYQLDGNMPALHQTIIFKSDGSAYFQENYGYKESDKKQTGKIYKSGFTNLNDFIISQCFLDYDNGYISQSPSDMPTIKITVQNDDITKSVTAKGEGYPPIGFWAIKNLIRYIKDQIKWEDVKE